MRLLSIKFRSWIALFGTAVLGLTGTAVQAQTPLAASPPLALPTIVSAPTALPPAVTGTAPTAIPCPPTPCCPTSPIYTGTPGTATTPGTPGMPGAQAGTSMADAGAFRSVTSGAGFSNSTAVGYIDSAIPVTQFRLRFDAAFDDNVPDRAAFFYAKCGCFPGAPGPGPNPNARVDFQEVSGMVEYALSERFSIFGEVPLRFLEPTTIGPPNGDTGGFSDINYGFKYAFLMDPCQVLTFQFRNYAPTGNPHEGLGNNLYVLEPALLYYRKLSENWNLEAEFRDWIPVATTDDFAGNVIRYGVGLSYHLYSGPSFRVTPVGELVGWTCLSGKELDLSAPNAERSAAGDTIVNAKIGARVGLGDGVSPGWRNQSDFYIGYGRALTDQVWYENVFRAEFRLRF